MTRGSILSWAADLDIDQGARIKIPVDSIPHGVNLLSAFSTNGDLLAERIVFIDKKQELKVEIFPDKSSLTAGESMNVKVRLTDEKNQPVSGNICIAVADHYRLNAGKPQIDESLLITSALENPFSLISSALKGKISQSVLLDIFMISNRMKNFSWTSIRNFNPGVAPEKRQVPKAVPGHNLDAQLSSFIEGYAQQYKLTGNTGNSAETYFAKNERLFQKPPKPEKDNRIAFENQRRLFQSATSILEVIKTLKPYHIQNNQIVFVGSENSINYQGGALIVLDGQMLGTDIGQLSGINPSDIDHINVSTNPMDIQRYTGLNSVGIIEIFQKKATIKEVAPAGESNEKYDQGYRIPGIFPAAPSNAKRDTRTTLAWIPEQIVDATGQCVFSVTAGSVFSDFEIEVQGISDNGRVGSGKALFSVAKN